MSGSAPVRPAWVPTESYPFEDHWAEIDGHLVHFVDEGEGPPLLLLNGNPSISSSSGTRGAGPSAWAWPGAGRS